MKIDECEMHLQVTKNHIRASYMLDLVSLMINWGIQKSCGTPRGTQVGMCGVCVAIPKMPKYRIFLTNMALGTKNINISGLKPISEAGNVLNYPKSPKRPVGMSGKSF